MASVIQQIRGMAINLEQRRRGLGPLHLFLVLMLFGWEVLAASPPDTQRPEAANAYEIWHADADWQQHHISALVQTRDGYLWLGTYFGLLRFDGAQCRVFDEANSPGLANALITSLYEDRRGVLWIGHKTGDVTRYREGRFEKVALDSSWPKGVVETIFEDAQGRVWMLSGNRSLCRLEEPLCLAVPGNASTTRQVSLASTAEGEVWLIFDGRLARLIQSKIEEVTLPGESGRATYDRVGAGRNGGVWIWGQNRLRKWRNNHWAEEMRLAPGGMPSANVMLETSSGTILSGTFKEGLYLLRTNDPPLHFSHADALSHDGVRALLEDREGNLWIGTHAGLDRLRRRLVQMLRAPDQWQGCVVLSFIVQPDRSVWVGTEGAGLYHFDGTSWSRNELSNPFVWSVLQSRSGQLYAGTWGGGLLRRQGNDFLSPAELRGIKEPVAALYEGKGGELWIGTGAGLHRYENGKITAFAGPDQLVQPDVRAITESADGSVWFGMAGGGLGVWQAGQVKQFTKADGLGSDFIVALHADTDGALWLGSLDNGLIRYKQGKFATLNTSRGLPNKNVSHIVDDLGGNLWLGLQQGGIACACKSDLNRCADGLIPAVHCLNYGRSEGLMPAGCSGGFQPGACRAPDGKLWFPTAKGLAIIDPAQVPTNAVAPPVLIEELLVDGQPVSLPKHAAGVRIPPGWHRFEFRYAGLSYIEPDQVRFKWRLKGLEMGWRDAGNRRAQEFNGLEPGDYVFEVMACNSAGVWNPTAATLALTVLPHYWQTVWFKALAGLAVLGAAGAAARQVTKRKLQKKLAVLRLQHALDRERSRIAQDMHDDIGSRLTEILLVGDQAQKNPPAASALVERMANVTREVIEHLDELVWAVNPRNDSLDKVAGYLYDYAQNILDTASIRARFEIPTRLSDRALSSELRHNLFMVVREALHNLIKHAACTEARIEFREGAGDFVIIIADNGCGFSLATNKRSGDGLCNMRERMANLGGRCELESAPGQGTRVSLQIPLPSHSNPKS